MKATRQTKLRSIVVLISAAILLELTTAIQYYSIRNGISKQLTEMAQRDIYETNHTAQLKDDVELAMSDILPEVKRYTYKNDIDSLRLLIKEMLKEEPEIVGVDFCRIVGQDGKRSGIYIYKDDDEDDFEEHSIDFDYTKRSWYSQALEADSFWSEPYKSNYKVMLMCTYSRPVYDKKGKKIAVIGADVPLYELSALATQFYDNQQRSMLTIAILHILGLAILAFIIWKSLLSTSQLQAANAEKERFSNELNIAGGIQQAMLPKTFPPYPDRNDIEIHALLSPARVVGGDFYDFLIRENKLFFCIGDVSGKGMPAALVMAVARSIFRTMSARENNPERIISAMNDMMAQDNDYNMFITIFVGVLELKTGQLRYTNAGHKAPFIGNKPLPIIPNLPVGVFPNFKFEPQEISMANGSTIFLYTDGLTEAENVSKDQFGEERMVDMLHDESPQQLIINMANAVHSFVGDTEQSDDLTMLAIRYIAKQTNEKLLCTMTLPCDVSQTPRIEELVEEACKDMDFPAPTIMQLNLALEEAVVNVMKYAYPPTVQGNLTIDATTDSEYLKFTITDNGQPFDPTKHGEVNTSLPVEERGIGGLGIHLMQRYMDKMEYKRHDGQNILTMSKKIKKTT